MVEDVDVTNSGVKDFPGFSDGMIITDSGLLAELPILLIATT